jgi:MFS family permease
LQRESRLGDFLPGGTAVPTPLYALYREKFGFSEITPALIHAAYIVGSVAAMFLLGRLSDQIGRVASYSRPAMSGFRFRLSALHFYRVSAVCCLRFPSSQR